VGFDLAEAEERSRRLRSLGLLGMRERAAAAGGELQVESAPGAGTVVSLRLALQEGSPDGEAMTL
jgi:signal transduction histidine kinase